MVGKRAVLVAVVGVVALIVVIGATLFHALVGGTPPVARGEGRARLPAAPPLHSHQAPPPAPAVPAIPVALTQIGGREPAPRLLAAGSWINTRGVTITVRMSSAMAATRLQPQVELRAAGHPFMGRATAAGAVVAYHGQAVLGMVHLQGLHDSVAYHWRVRVHDLHGPDSPWAGLPGVALRVYIGRPAAPRLALVTPAHEAGWVATRWLTWRWTSPGDLSGIRGYSYTLSRSPGAEPALRWRTGLPGATVRAAGDGMWYFSVRTLNKAHTWGPAARLAVHVDTMQPRLRQVIAPAGTVNPPRTRPLLRMALTDLSQVTVHVVAPGGRVVRSLATQFHPRGYQLALNWDGRDAAGRLVPNGAYELRIAAVNHAGAAWRVTRRLSVETTPPGLGLYGLSQTGTYNPYNNGLDGPEVITATLTSAARVRIEAVHGESVRRAWTFNNIRAGQVITATWNGKAADGVVTPGGLYTFRLVAVDAAGNQAALKLGWVVVDHRRIVVSLDQQQLWALDGNRVLLTSLVTTGGPELPTPTGDFQVIDRESPFTFHSPFPKTSPFWYPPSPTNFALLFDLSGYFLHDAPWRGYFGPGSNAVYGTPGSNTTGSHGCVNVPYYPMQWLFNWATMYTPVQVRQSFAPMPQ